MEKGNLKKLSSFDIKEIIYNTGIKDFTDGDLNFWLDKNPDDFLNLYVNNKDNKIKRTENTVELYYNGVDFEGNLKQIPFEDKSFGFYELSRAPLYNKKDNKEIGLAQFLCSINFYKDTLYIDCDTTYFLDNSVIPEQVVLMNKSSIKNNDFGKIQWKEGFKNKKGEGTFFQPGDYSVSYAEYALENGLNRTIALVNVYLPLNNDKKKRSVVINFDTVQSNNFLPQKNYGLNRIEERNIELFKI
jgi:hypothetical protein